MLFEANVTATVTTAVPYVPRDSVEFAGGDELTVGVDNGDVARSLILVSHHKHDGQLLPSSKSGIMGVSTRIARDTVH